jgi:hypothetical protein
MVTAPAGASTVSDGKVAGTLSPWPGSSQSVQGAENAALLQWYADGKPTYYMPTGGASHAYVQCDQSFLWACTLYGVYLTHGDVTNALAGLIGGYVASAVGLICGVLAGDPAAAFACGLFIAAEAAVVQFLMYVAAHAVTWLNAWWCGAPGTWLCSAASIPSAWWNSLDGEWVFPAYITGLTVEVSFFGTVTGWQYAYNGA